MAHDLLLIEPLGPQDALLLTALLTASDVSQPWVEAKVFRRDQLEHRKAIDRLEQAGYIRKERVGETECYCVSLTAMAQMRDHPLIASILDTAELMWRAYRDHYKTALDAPITLKAIADSIGVPIDHVTLVHTYMREWWHTPGCFTPADALYQSVAVREDVLDFQSFDDCIWDLRQVQLRRLQTAPHGFANSPWSGDASVAADKPLLPAFLEPSWFGKLPPHAQALMREMHTARHSGLMALTAMGVRAVIDVVADDLLGSADWGFARKLAALYERGHLTADQHQVIGAVIEVGHAAAHRAHVPTERDVQLMQEALEHVLCSTYGLQNAQQELMARTPPGSKPAKTGKVI